MTSWFGPGPPTIFSMIRKQGRVTKHSDDAGTLAAVNQTLKSGAKAAVEGQLDALLDWVPSGQFKIRRQIIDD